MIVIVRLPTANRPRPGTWNAATEAAPRTKSSAASSATSPADLPNPSADLSTRTPTSTSQGGSKPPGNQRSGTARGLEGRLAVPSAAPPQRRSAGDRGDHRATSTAVLAASRMAGSSKAKLGDEQRHGEADRPPSPCPVTSPAPDPVGGTADQVLTRCAVAAEMPTVFPITRPTTPRSATARAPVSDRDPTSRRTRRWRGRTAGRSRLLSGCRRCSTARPR